MFRMAHMDHCCSFLMVRSRDVPMCKAMALDVEAFAVDGFKWTRSTIPKLEINWISIKHFKSPAKMWDLTFTKIQKQEIWQSKKSDVTIQTWSMLQAPAPVTWWTWNGTGSMFAAAWMVQLVQDPRPVSTKRLDIGIIQWYNIISYIYICSI